MIVGSLRVSRGFGSGSVWGSGLSGGDWRQEETMYKMHGGHGDTKMIFYSCSKQEREQENPVGTFLEQKGMLVLVKTKTQAMFYDVHL